MTDLVLFTRGEMDDLIAKGYTPHGYPLSMRLILPDSDGKSWAKMMLQESREFGQVFVYSPCGYARTEKAAREWLMEKS